MDTFDLDLVRHALKVAQEHGFAEVELAVEGSSFRACFEPGVKKAAKPSAQPEDAKVAIVDAEFKVIKSPIVGIYRPGPTPMKPGLTVKQGDIVAVINALGIANEVESLVSGEIEEVYVEDGAGVEFGQVLAKVKG